MPTTFRPIRPGDLDRFVELCDDHSTYERLAYDPAGKRERLHALLFSETPALTVWLAEATGEDRSENAGETRREIIGFASWMPQLSTWDAAHYAYLDCLYLDEAARGQGLGQKLMALVAADVVAAGLPRIEWQALRWNEGAIRFYERVGGVDRPRARFTLTGDALHALATQTA